MIAAVSVPLLSFDRDPDDDVNILQALRGLHRHRRRQEIVEVCSSVNPPALSGVCVNQPETGVEFGNSHVLSETHDVFRVATHREVVRIKFTGCIKQTRHNRRLMVKRED